jgi:hypothetical protein
MADDASPRYSAFWPMTIVLTAFAISFIVQIVGLIERRGSVNREYAQAAQAFPKAQAAHDRLVALLKDVAGTARTDPNAAQIVRLSLQSGILQQRAAAPAGSETSAAPATPETNAAPANP